MKISLEFDTDKDWLGSKAFWSSNPDLPTVLLLSFIFAAHVLQIAFSSDGSMIFDEAQYVPTWHQAVPNPFLWYGFWLGVVGLALCVWRREQLGAVTFMTSGFLLNYLPSGNQLDGEADWLQLLHDLCSPIRCTRNRPACRVVFDAGAHASQAADRIYPPFSTLNSPETQRESKTISPTANSYSGSATSALKAHSHLEIQKL